MIISNEQINVFASYLKDKDIIKFCIDNYIEFNNFQLNGKKAYIFSEEENLAYEREMTEQWETQYL